MSSLHCVHFTNVKSPSSGHVGNSAASLAEVGVQRRKGTNPLKIPQLVPAGMVTEKRWQEDVDTAGFFRDHRAVT